MALYQTSPDTTLNLDETLAGLSGLELSDWIWAGGIFAGSIILAFAVRRVATSVVGRGTSPFIARLVGRFLAALVFVLGLVYALNQLGVAIGPLLGLLGLAGLALALAFQDILENVIAGVLISIRRPFDAGDQISTSGYEGTVEDVNLRVVSLVTYDGVRVYVPNASVWRNPIVNFTDLDVRRTTLEVGVSYGADLDAVQEVLVDVLRGVPGVVDQPAPQALVHEFGESGITFAVRYWHAPQIAAEWATRDAVARAIRRRFASEGIEIPFPQRVLHVASVPPGLPGAKP